MGTQFVHASRLAWVAVLLMAVGACTSDQKPAAPRASGTTSAVPTVPATHTPGAGMRPGPYVSASFQPMIFYSVEEPWQGGFNNETAVDLFQGRNQQLSFIAGAGASVAAVVDSLRSTPGLTVLSEASAMVGGVAGPRLDVAAENPNATIRLLEGYQLRPRSTLRVLVLEVAGKIVVVAIQALETTFQSFLSAAERVLATVRFG